ncbi:hypothetical protein PMAYCL1PPCAC_18087, partial [Pristionchus mayeri]
RRLEQKKNTTLPILTMTAASPPGGSSSTDKSWHRQDSRGWQGEVPIEEGKREQRPVDWREKPVLHLLHCISNHSRISATRFLLSLLMQSHSLRRREDYQLRDSIVYRAVEVSRRNWSSDCRWQNSSYSSPWMCTQWQ